jgi:RNA polymerase sigma-70 factor (ECF subfamily)
MSSRDRFEALYRAYCDRVAAFVYRRTPAATADDVVAEVFLIAWRRLEEVPEDELAWLLRITRGVLSNRRRGEGRRSALRERLVAHAAAEERVRQDSSEGESPVLRALACLGERDREVLLFVAWDGLDRAQAARVLGISSGAFAVRLHRARRRLERALAAIKDVERRAGERSSAMEVS